MDAHQPSRKEIDDRGDVHLLSVKDDLREIGRPDVVWIRGHHGEEEVREHPLRL